MKNLLIISSTKNSNFELSKDIKKFFDSKKILIAQLYH